MPRLYIPLRASSSSSSSSRPARPPLPAPSISSRLPPRDQAAAPPPPPARPQTRFHTSASNLLAAQSSRPHVITQVHGPEARLHGTSALNYSSSGSLHHHDPSSVCLSAMVHEFLEEQEEEEPLVMSSSLPCGRARCNCADGVCGDETCAVIETEDDASDRVEYLCEILEGLTSSTSKAELLLLIEVGKAVEEMMAVEEGDANLSDSSKLRRPVMKRLREMGYNAAACKSRWNHGDGLPAGDYEYIDVLMEGKEGKEERMIVDIDFKAQFEIARPSSGYSQLLNLVPKVFVGKAERVKQMVKMMSRAAKHSLQAQGLVLPPWRKSKYMQAKWLSPIYRRTTNVEPTKQYKSLQINTQDEVLTFGGLRAYEVQLANEDGGSKGCKLGLVANKEDTRASAKRLYMSRDNDPMVRESKGDHLLFESKEKVVRRGFEGTDFWHNKKPFHDVKYTRDVCTAMCTSWQLPSLEDKPFIAARVSALSIALQQEQRRHISPTIVSIVS